MKLFALGQSRTIASRWLRETKNFCSRHPRLMLASAFMLTWIVASFIFFVRYPNNALQPNFYAEDGKDFMTTILAEPVLESTFKPFNGYFVVGLYLLGEVAVVVHTVFFGGNYIELPKSLAIASYAFLGFCAALPILTLNRTLKPIYLGLAVLAVAFAPMPLNDYVVIGTLGNLKFAFGFIAALLVIKRIGMNRHSRLIPLIDIGVMLCAFTTASVYLILPFYLLADGLRPRQLWHWHTAFNRHNLALWSALVLGMLLMIQIAYVAIHGIPKLPGYLDEPYQPAATVEIFGARTLLFGLMPCVYRFLADWSTVIILLVVTLTVVITARRHQLSAIIILTTMSLTASVLFVANRTGLSGMFKNYTWSGPDQFFYAQTMMMATVGIIILQAIVARFRWRWISMTAPVVGLGLIILTAPYASTYGADNSMEAARGTIYNAAKAACQNSSTTVKINIYPTEPWQVSVPRNEVCTPALYRYKTYQLIDFGLNVTSNKPVNITTSSFRQSITSELTAGDIAGIELLVSTYNRRATSDYSIVFYQSDCVTRISSTKVDFSDAKDNSWFRIMVPPLSKSKPYCFSLVPSNKSAQALAVQQSGINPQGLAPAVVNRKFVEFPIAFRLISQD